MSAILEFADKLKSQVDIADVVGRYVDLRRLGHNMKGLCPFHNEKTPSFTVSTSKQIFHCFGCHEGGDVIKFVQKIERMEWMDALRHLSREYAIPMPELQRDRADAGARNEERDQREAAVAAVQFAAEFFSKHLHSKVVSGGEIRAYLNTRGLGPDAVARFGLGLAPDGWTGLFDAALKAGHPRESLLNSGLATRHATKDSVYDRFRNRLIFPIQDVHGSPIAFGARVYAATASPDEPKYINSPETLAYHKGQALYALHLAKDEIVRQETAVLMEGYMDVIAAHVAGITNCVASCGTALTDEQARLLKRFCQKVIFLYDGDAAGQKAMLRGTEVLLAQGLSVSIVNLPDNHDPDSYLKEFGTDKMRETLAKAAPFFDHFLAMAGQRYDFRAAEGKVQTVELLLPLLRRIQQPIIRNEYVRRLADRLQVDAILIQRQLSSANPQSLDRLRQAVAETHDVELTVVEKQLLKVIIECPSARVFLLSTIQPEWLRNSVARKWFTVCKRLPPDEIGWDLFLSSGDIENESERAVLTAIAVEELGCDAFPQQNLENVAKRIHRNYEVEQSKLRSQLTDTFYIQDPDDPKIIEITMAADRTPARGLVHGYHLKSDITPDRH